MIKALCNIITILVILTNATNFTNILIGDNQNWQIIIDFRQNQEQLIPGNSIEHDIKIENDTDMDYDIKSIRLSNLNIITKNTCSDDIIDEFKKNVIIKMIVNNDICLDASLDYLSEPRQLQNDISLLKEEYIIIKFVIKLSKDATNNLQNIDCQFDLALNVVEADDDGNNGGNIVINDPNDNNKNRQSANVLNTRPVIYLIGPKEVSICVGDEFCDPSAIALDEEDGIITDRLECSINDGNSELNTDKAGDCTINYNVTDSGGLKAVAKKRILHIEKTKKTAVISKPIITLIGDYIVEVEEGTQYVDEGAIAYDSIDGDITEHIVIKNNIDIDKPGEYSITYDVINSLGIPANQVIRKIIVKDIIVIKVSQQLPKTGHRIPIIIYLIGIILVILGIRIIRYSKKG